MNFDDLYFYNKGYHHCFLDKSIAFLGIPFLDLSLQHLKRALVERMDSSSPFRDFFLKQENEKDPAT